MTRRGSGVQIPYGPPSDEAQLADEHPPAYRVVLGQTRDASSRIDGVPVSTSNHAALRLAVAFLTPPAPSGPMSSVPPGLELARFPGAFGSPSFSVLEDHGGRVMVTAGHDRSLGQKHLDTSPALVVPLE